MKLHPYAIILGVGIGVMVLFALRHPLFSLLATVISVLGFDVAFKKKIKNIDDDSDSDSE